MGNDFTHDGTQVSSEPTKISRREVAVKLGGLAAILAALGGLTAACSQNALNTAAIVINAFKLIQPILSELVPTAAATIAKAIKVAEDLQAALKKKAPEAIDFLKQLIAPDGLFNQVFDDLALVTDPAKRKMLTLWLLIAETGLAAIATALHQEAPAGVIAKANAKGKSVSIIEAIAKSNWLESALTKF